MIGTFDLAVGVAAATVVVVGAEGLIEAEWVDRLLAIGSVAILMALFVTLIFVAPWSLWREEHQRCADLEAERLASPYVDMLLPPPQAGDDGSMLAIGIENPSSEPRTFAVKVHGLTGLTSPTTPLWWVPWRGATETHERRLLAHEREILDVGIASPDGIVPTRMRSPGEPRNDRLQFTAPESELCLRIWDTESGALVAEGWINISYGADDKGTLHSGLSLYTPEVGEPWPPTRAEERGIGSRRWRRRGARRAPTP